MARIVRSDAAKDDIFGISEFIAQDRPTAANRLLEKIDRILDVLARQPTLGESLEYTRPGLRRISQGNYVIYFEPIIDGIRVIRVLHGARKIEDLL
jgi:toxin ParE1/3/4